MREREKKEQIVLTFRLLNIVQWREYLVKNVYHSIWKKKMTRLEVNLAFNYRNIISTKYFAAVPLISFDFNKSVIFPRGHHWLSQILPGAFINVAHNRTNKTVIRIWMTLQSTCSSTNFRCYRTGEFIVSLDARDAVFLRWEKKKKREKNSREQEGI